MTIKITDTTQTATVLPMKYALGELFALSNKIKVDLKQVFLLHNIQEVLKNAACNTICLTV